MTDGERQVLHLVANALDAFVWRLECAEVPEEEVEKALAYYPDFRQAWQEYLDDDA